MTYTVSYKRVGGFFVNKIKNVKQDGFVFDRIGSSMYFKKSRFFILEDDSRIEIPTKDMIFFFSKERAYVIKKNMEAESGQTIPKKQ